MADYRYRHNDGNLGWPREQSAQVFTNESRSKAEKYRTPRRKSKSLNCYRPYSSSTTISPSRTAPSFNRWPIN